jgi:thiamine pyrophosphate-dependent acetolactate synthase large subunit-like protein
MRRLIAGTVPRFPEAAMRSDVPAVRADGRGQPTWGSDAIADAISGLGLRYVALTPGSSYRGLHDSLVNYLGGREPQIILCLHEEHAVALAHGYAKVTEAPMGVALHSNVGLMHAAMALYNAYCDRVPMLVIGATGPVDAALRRPWIDWIHTSADQGALVRPYTKWDDQPGSVPAAVEAIYRANALTRAYPPAPVYVCLDSAIQEMALSEPVQVAGPGRYPPPPPPAPAPDLVEKALTLLQSSQRPLVLVGRVGRGPDDWERRVSVAERLGACVITDLKVGAGFPSGHPLHPVAPATFLPDASGELIRQADVILSLDWVDLGGTLRQAHGGQPVTARIISCSADYVLHNGWSKDHFALPPVDVMIPGHPDYLIRAMDARLAGSRDGGGAKRADRAVQRAGPKPGESSGAITAPGAGRASSRAGESGAVGMSGSDAVTGGMSVRRLAADLGRAVAGQCICLVRLPLGWSGEDLHVAGPLDYLGQDGGAGVGSGPGMLVGAALGLEGSGRLAVGVLGDGDFLMGASALWTAAHYQLPLLLVVANNRSFFNDEVHQERVALRRGRPTENRWLGQQIRDPVPDLAALARSLGLVGYGPVVDPGELPAVLEKSVAEAALGATVVLDVHVSTYGYPGLSASATGTSGASADGTSLR